MLHCVNTPMDEKKAALIPAAEIVVYEIIQTPYGTKITAKTIRGFPSHPR